MHLQLEPWFSGPASGCGFKDLFETSQNTYLHSGLYVSSRKCRDVIPSRAMQPQVCGAALPSSDFPCTPSPSTQDQAPDTHPLKPAAFLLSSETISASKERQQEGYDLKKNPKNTNKKRQNAQQGGIGEGRLFLTVGCDFVGGVEARVSAGWSAHVQMEQDVLPQPVASFF